MTYYLQQPATCTKCGHHEPANGSDDDGKPKIDGRTVCPKCFNEMLKRFCGYMQDDQGRSPKW